MRDNLSAHMSTEYDAKITSTIPNFDSFYQSTIDLVCAAENPADKWLDTGCGTGTFCVKAKRCFANTEFTLSDPSEAMLKIAKEKLKSSEKVSFELADTQSLVYPDEYFDVISAIQCHHFLDRAGRIQATENCFRMLKRGGIYIEFENIMPLTKGGREIGLRMWWNYQSAMGKTPDEVAEHGKRFNVEYFPITIPDHISLLSETGFSIVEVLWASYMQAGFYAVK